MDFLNVIVGGTAGAAGAVLIYFRGMKDLFTPEPEQLEELEEAPPARTFKDEYQELMWLADNQRHGPISYVETLRFYELREKWPQLHGEVHPA